MPQVVSWIFAALLVSCFGGAMLWMLLMFLVACFEKVPICTFVAAEDVEIPSYMAAMINHAKSKGFGQMGTGRHSKFGDRITAVLMLSEDARTIAMIGQGRIYGLRAKKTFLISQLQDKRMLITQDEAGMPEFDPNTTRQLLINADFDELLSLHESDPRFRIAFPSTISWDVVDDMYQQRVSRIVHLGLARYTDNHRDNIRFTAKAAFRTVFIYIWLQIMNNQNRSRSRRKRPDSRCPNCGYDLRATDGRCPECGRTIDEI